MLSNMKSTSSRPRRSRTRTVRYATSIPSPSSSSSDEQDENDIEYNPIEKAIKRSAQCTSPTKQGSSSSSLPPSPKAQVRKKRASKRPRLQSCATVDNPLPSSHHEKKESQIYKTKEYSITSTSFTQCEIQTIRHNLLSWYFVNHRKFPWRASPRLLPSSFPTKTATVTTIPATKTEEDEYLPEPGSPYSVWVSEVMSQQTRIEVVISYYKRWMQKFPTLLILSKASSETVNELWSGLGYYRRARFLHTGAKQVIKEYNGNLPSDTKTLRRLSGIGEYTAGAISSIAFGKDEACVDGNIERVLCRLRPGIGGMEDNEKERKKEIWNLANDLVSDCSVHGLNAGDLNQAFMEIGATICKPRFADCNICPLKGNICGAWKEAILLNDLEDGVDGKVIADKYPAKKGKKKTKVRNEAVIAIVVWSKLKERTKILTVKRGNDEDGGLLSGLWEVINVVCGPKFIENEEEEEGNIRKQLENGEHKIWEKVNHVLSDSRDVEIKMDSLKRAGRVTHIFSHIRQELAVYTVRVDDDDDDDEGERNGLKYRWIDVNDIGKAAISTQMKKVIAKGLKCIDERNIDVKTRQ